MPAMFNLYLHDVSHVGGQRLVPCEKLTGHIGEGMSFARLWICL